MVSDQTIKAGGFKQRRKVKTFSKEKTDGGRFGISRDTSCPAKSSTAFVTVKPTRRLTIKCQERKGRNERFSIAAPGVSKAKIL